MGNSGPQKRAPKEGGLKGRIRIGKFKGQAKGDGVTKQGTEGSAPAAADLAEHSVKHSAQPLAIKPTHLPGDRFVKSLQAPRPW